MIKKLLFYCLASLVLISCNEDDDTIQSPNPPNPGDEILLVGNEGLFSGTNASLTSINLSTQEVQQNIFALSNEGAVLGSILQSIYQLNNEYYLVVNNSQKIEVVSADDFSQQRIISFANGSPRHILPLGDSKAYVSDLFGGGIHRVNPSTGTYEGFINATINSEHLIQVGDEVWFTEPFGNKIGFINTTTDAFLDDLTLSANPSGFVRDTEGDIWVFCGGDAFSSPQVAPVLYEIDPSSKSIIRSIEIDSSPGYNSIGIAIDPSGENIYFLSGDIYRVDISLIDLNPEVFFESGSRTLYSLFLNPNTGMIGCTDAKDYVQNGDVVLLNPDGSNAGIYSAGIVPNALFWVNP